MKKLLLFLWLSSGSLHAGASCSPLGQIAAPAALENSSVKFFGTVGKPVVEEARFGTPKCKMLSQSASATLHDKTAAAEWVFAVIQRECLSDVLALDEVLKYHLTVRKDACAKPPQNLSKITIGRNEFYVAARQAEWLQNESLKRHGVKAGAK